jgi:hypothetical protein
MRLPSGIGDGDVVFVPRDGMNVHPAVMCTNDHLFLCPRHLCRAYFELAELWESPHCRRDGRATAATGSTPILKPTVGHSVADVEPLDTLADIFATADARAPFGLRPPHAPNKPFLLPALPVLADAQWYWLARYGGARDSPCDARKTTDGRCCGLVRELPFAYNIARDPTYHNMGHVALVCKLVSVRNPKDTIKPWNESMAPFETNLTRLAEERTVATAECEALTKQATTGVGLKSFQQSFSLRGAMPTSSSGELIGELSGRR